ncbi:MAG TPA: DUF3788 family protein [Gemmatimonadales bacterium]|nr:DUF3788 family protein [Gemmatimonadales bacterium]
MGRSSSYWQGNRYPTSSAEPDPKAPLKDLPANAAARFKLVRNGLRAIPGVVEHVKFLGPQWRWAWEYTLGNRKLCWIHVMQDGVSATFTISDGEERRVRDGRLPVAVTQAITEAQRTGPVRWCWLGLTDQRVSAAFLGFARKKAEWMREEAPPGSLRRAAG